MANKDLITEQILSIEDFNNVDAGLMRIIESNDEYRRIFEECKEISKLTSECIPEPVKNGVSLHDAVMNRVKSGDTAPRYTQGSGRRFAFPMATAASLVIVLAVAIIATIAPKTRDSRSIFDAADNSMSYSQEAKILPDATFMPLSEAFEDISDEEISDAKISEVPKTEAANGGNRLKKANDPTAPSSMKMQKPEQGDDITNDNVDFAAQYDGSTFNASAAASETPIVMAGYPESDESGVTEESSSEDDRAIDDRLAKAEQHPDYNGQIIPPEIIEMFGKDKFIEWFDAIVDDPDFATLYTLAGFMDYCNADENSVEDIN